MKYTEGICPLDDPVTWNKITHASEQVAQWDLQNDAPAFFFTGMCDFVPCDRVVQKGYRIGELTTDFHTKSQTQI